jgi:hypothetical protein
MYIYAHKCVRCSTYCCLCLVHMLCVCWSRSLARAHSIYISLCNCTYTHICMSVCTLHIVPGPCVCVCVHQRALQQWVFLPTNAESSSCDLRACVFFLSLCVRTCMRALAYVPLCASRRRVPPPECAGRGTNHGAAACGANRAGSGARGARTHFGLVQVTLPAAACPSVFLVPPKQ